MDNAFSTTAKPSKEADMDIEQTLREKTYKGNGEGVARRVLATLEHKDSASSSDLSVSRTKRLLCLLLDRLVEKELLSEAELDAMLLELFN